MTLRNNIFWILLVSLLSCDLLAGQNAVTYQLLVDEETPQAGRFIVDTHEIPQFELLLPRSQPFSEGQIELDVLCIDVSGKASSAKYGVPIQCSRIEWVVEFKVLASYDYDASKQQNLFSPKGWWMLTEWGDIPRIEGVETTTVCANKISSRAEETCHRLPGIGSAPLFLVWGKDKLKYSIGSTKFRVFADSGLDAGQLPGLEGLLKKQLHYLSNLKTLDKPDIEDIEVVWIGRDEKYKQMGGAAGSQAYISNYRIKNEKVDINQINLLIWISGHELFHMLSLMELPLWASESLAHYYGYKSMSESGFETEATPLELWVERQASQIHAESGLYSANEMVTQQNDMSYYGLFYDKGAAFWHELDVLLAQNKSSLDDFLYLLSEPDSNNGRLNGKFSDAMVEEIGESRYEKLVDEYL